jgi:hypothetical protein
MCDPSKLSSGKTEANESARQGLVTGVDQVPEVQNVQNVREKEQRDEIREVGGKDEEEPDERTHPAAYKPHPAKLLLTPHQTS